LFKIRVVLLKALSEALLKQRGAHFPCHHLP